MVGARARGGCAHVARAAARRGLHAHREQPGVACRPCCHGSRRSPQERAPSVRPRPCACRQPSPAQPHLEREEGVADDLAAAPGRQQRDQAELQRGRAAQRHAQQRQRRGARGRRQVHNAPQDEQAGGHLRGCGTGGRGARAHAGVGSNRVARTAAAHGCIAARLQGSTHEHTVVLQQRSRAPVPGPGPRTPPVIMTGERTRPTALCTTSITAAVCATFSGSSTACVCAVRRAHGARPAQGSVLEPALNRPAAWLVRAQLSSARPGTHARPRAPVHLPDFRQAAAAARGLVCEEQDVGPAGGASGGVWPVECERSAGGGVNRPCHPAVGNRTGHHTMAAALTMPPPARCCKETGTPTWATSLLLRTRSQAGRRRARVERMARQSGRAASSGGGGGGSGGGDRSAASKRRSMLDVLLCARTVSLTSVNPPGAADSSGRLVASRAQRPCSNRRCSGAHLRRWITCGRCGSLWAR